MVFPPKPPPFPVRRPTSPYDPVSAVRLSLRLQALAAALDDLPGQARRFARWKAHSDAFFARERERREAASAKNRENCAPGSAPRRVAAATPIVKRRRGRFERVSGLKPGRPPGGRKKPTHEVHKILKDLHYFVREVQDEEWRQQKRAEGRGGGPAYADTS